MSGRFDDEALRSMLESRAARARPEPLIEGWAAPARRKGVSGTRWIRSAAVPLALVVLLVGGIALVGRPGVWPWTGGPSDGGPSASVVASPDASLAETLESVRLEAFLLDLASGELNGRLVIATGQLEMLPTRCLNPADPPGCFRLRFQGRDDPEVIRDTELGTTRAAELVARDPATHPLAFRVDSSNRLVLLGALLQDPGSPLVPADLAGDAIALSRDELAVVRGVLVGKGAAEPCPSQPTLNGCPPPSAWLTPRWPRPADVPPYAAGVGVTTRGADDLVGPYPDARSATFLVEGIRQRGGQYVPWNIVGQVDAPTTVRVTITPP
jgi:hypothetical protein